MLLNFLFEILEDLQRLSKAIADKAGAMKLLGVLVVVVLAGFGFYLSWDWWNTPLPVAPTYSAIPACLVLIVVVAYLTIKIERAREPRLEASELQPDGSTWSMDVRVTNKGPGKTRPTVTITHLRDGNGKEFPFAVESYKPREAHWRWADEKNWNPLLKKGQSASAGVLWIIDADTEYPTICTYPNDLKAHSPLWHEPVPLSKQTGIQLTILISYIRSSGRDAKTITRHYYLRPDPSERLRYRIERVTRFD